jgi:hypothetical protein
VLREIRPRAAPAKLTGLLAAYTSGQRSLQDLAWEVRGPALAHNTICVPATIGERGDPVSEALRVTGALLAAE